MARHASEHPIRNEDAILLLVSKRYLDRDAFDDAKKTVLCEFMDVRATTARVLWLNDRKRMRFVDAQGLATDAPSELDDVFVASAEMMQRRDVTFATFAEYESFFADLPSVSAFKAAFLTLIVTLPRPPETSDYIVGMAGAGDHVHLRTQVHKLQMDLDDRVSPRDVDMELMRKRQEQADVTIRDLQRQLGELRLARQLSPE